MKFQIPAREPRTPECKLTHGGRLLTLTVERQGGKRRVTTVYLVEREAGLVRLVKDDGTVYTVSLFGCDCRDDQYRGREVECKHAVAVRELGLLKAVAACEGTA